MQRKLQSLFDDLEVSRVKILDTVSALSEDAFIKPIRTGKWSVAQILTHLVASEKMSLGYMKKKSLGVETLTNSGMIEDLKLLVLKISQRIPLKYKAPKILLERTPPSSSLSEISVQWSNSRIELFEFLNSIEQRNIKKKIYKHPVAGRLDVTQALQFFKEHVHHHKPQIERIIRNKNAGKKQKSFE